MRVPLPVLSLLLVSCADPPEREPPVPYAGPLVVDGCLDGEVPETWYPDADDDGYGGDAYGRDTCEPPLGWIRTGGDCDDLDAERGPDQREDCNELDDDCDGVVDEVELPEGTTFWRDLDADGYGDPYDTQVACERPLGFIDNAQDCDDSDASINPDAEEQWYDGVDQDCDGGSDHDADGDGYDAVNGGGTDCDDTLAHVYPYAEELCDGVDGDCDGEIDEDAVDGVTWFVDADGDGHGSPSTSAEACEAPAGFVADPDDCDDSDPALSPSTTEHCGNGIDDDCDGYIDDEDLETWYRDADGDGAGDMQSTMSQCQQPFGYVEDSTDCDDDDPDLVGIALGVELPAQLDIEYAWDGYAKVSSYWELDSDGSFESKGGSPGTWTYDCEAGEVTLGYVSGTSYWGTTSDGLEFDGEMESTSGLGGSWSGSFD